jgi:hypothetical protein
MMTATMAVRNKRMLNELIMLYQWICGDPELRYLSQRWFQVMLDW